MVRLGMVRLGVGKKPCGCKESKAIKARADAQHRQMTTDETIRALAADLRVSPDDLERWMGLARQAALAPERI
jgi:cytochrome c-type biogenesis protein CcmH/NrfG